MKKNIIADFMLLMVAFVWGTTFIAVQNAIDILPPHSFNAVRFLTASVIILILAFIFDRKNLFNITKEVWIAGFLLGLFLFFGYAFQTLGLLYTSASKAGFITGLNVILVPIFATILLKVKPKLTAIIGVSLAAIGLYIMTMIGSTSFSYGDFLVFLCAIFFALQIVSTGKYAPKYSAFVLAWIQISVVGVLSLIATIIFEDVGYLTNPDILLDKDVIIALLITSVFATALAFLAQTTFQKHSTPTKVAIIFAMEPVFAAIASVIYQKEMLSINVTIGGSLIFMGMILAEIPSEKITAPFMRKKDNKIQSTT
ncbi:MAG: DMT family transporter [Vulcanibacillus sp.]